VFEYANSGTLFLEGISIFFVLILIVFTVGKAQSEGRDSQAGLWGMIGIMILTSMIIYEGTSSKERAMESFKKFDKQGEIICNSLSTKYIVSLPRGWKRYKDGFTKNDIILNVRECRVEE